MKIFSCVALGTGLLFAGLPTKVFAIPYYYDTDDPPAWHCEELPDPPVTLANLTNTFGLGEGPRAGTLLVQHFDGLLAVYDIATASSESLGISFNGTALGYGGDGYWYASAGNEAKQLVRFHVHSGASVETVGFGAFRIEDLATSPEGITYGVGEGLLFQINRATGGQTVISNLGFQATSLAFIGNGQMISARGSELVGIDRTTGAVTALGRTLIDSPLDFAGSAVPEPATWLALGVGVVAIVRRRRTRR